MFNGQHSKQLIESLYMKNDKNFDRTLEQFLSGNIPKDEYKVVVIPEETTTMIDTLVKPSKPPKSDLLDSYIMGAFEGSKVRKNKNRQYYEQHMKAMEEAKR